MNPEKIKYLFDKGLFLRGTRDYPDAASVLRVAAQQAPENINDLIARGKSWEKLRENAKARECYLHALAMNPYETQAHHGLARLVLPGPHYLEGLRLIHANLQPATYVEIGIRNGASFRLASPGIPAIGIDPNPLIDTTGLPERHIIIKDTSDNYFQSGRLSSDLGGQPIDLGFIDGMHLFEFALRDFIALEKFAHPDATILLHDCYPLNEITARREQETYFWSGDVWKLILCLKQYRKDLRIVTLPCPPTGLAVITCLNPFSTVLSDSLIKICDEYVTLKFTAIAQDRGRKLNLVELTEAPELHCLQE